MSTRGSNWSAILAIAALVLAACGGDTAGQATTTQATPGTTAPSETTTTAAPTTTEVAEGCAGVDLASSPDEPVTIRIGHGRAAEEPFWLMTVKPDVTQYQGSWYEMELVPFRGTEERLQAYQAGDLDAVIITPNALVRGEATGALDLYSIVTVMREAEEGAFSTTFVALADSGISEIEDLPGTIIAIVDVGSHLDFLARTAIQMAGADPDTGAQYVVFPFPAQEEALRGGQIQVAGLPEPFYSLAHANGGVVDVFSAADILDFGFDLLTLSFDRTFVEENLGAVCAWRNDYQASMEFWRTQNEEARMILAETDFIPLPPQVYAQTGDYFRPEGGAVDPEGLGRFIEGMIELGVLDESERVDPQVFIKPGVTAGN